MNPFCRLRTGGKETTTSTTFSATFGPLTPRHTNHRLPFHLTGCYGRACLSLLTAVGTSAVNPAGVSSKSFYCSIGGITGIKPPGNKVSSGHPGTGSILEDTEEALLLPKKRRCLVVVPDFAGLPRNGRNNHGLVRRHGFSQPYNV